MPAKIIILDFGSQVTQLIARRIREIGIFSEIVPNTIDDHILQNANLPVKGIILSGGPNSVTEMGSPRAPDWVFTCGLPVLGICYGMQTMAVQLGGDVVAGKVREFGLATIEILQENSLCTQTGAVWMSHGDHVATLPPGFSTIARTPTCPIAAMADAKRQFYGLQFHPEVTHTPDGLTMLRHFVQNICGVAADWQMHNYIPQSIAKIQQKVGKEQVILGLSGGVDSSVAAVLIHRAIARQLTCVFVDTGLLRLQERQRVEQLFTEHLGVHVIYIDAQDRFMAALSGITDPEEKRKIIGKTFVQVFQEEAQKIPNARWLAQGTIYPDVIESGGISQHATTIKSHHNVGGLPKDLHLKLLEPLRDLFKDEVRKLGSLLGLPASMIYRHPFPGPGLGVRILGEIRKTYADLLRQADAIFMEELQTCDETGKTWYEKTSQAFAVFLPIKTVGTMGDARSYEYVIALRAVHTEDFMTAQPAALPHILLQKIAARIINEVRGINRVTYDISSKPPATIEWE